MRSSLTLLAALTLAASACGDSAAPPLAPAAPTATAADAALTFRLHHPGRQGPWLIEEAASGLPRAVHGDPEDIFAEMDAFYATEMTASPGSTRARAAARERDRVRAWRDAMRAPGDGRAVYTTEELADGARLLSVRVNDGLFRETLVPGSLASDARAPGLARRTDCSALEWFIDEYIVPEACDVGETAGIEAELAALDAAAAAMLASLPASEPDWGSECQVPNSTARQTSEDGRQPVRAVRPRRPDRADGSITTLAQSSDDECGAPQRTSSGLPAVGGGAASADIVPLLPWRAPAKCREAYWEAVGASGAFLAATGFVGYYIGARMPLRALKALGAAGAAYAVAGSKISKYQYCVSTI